MNNNLFQLIQSMTIEQLKEEIDKNIFIEKDLRDFNKGKKVIDNMIELNEKKVSENVKNALLIYCIYKLKGGK